MGLIRRLVSLPRRVAVRLWEELLTRKGRRRLRRRLASRFLLVAVAIAWTYPFVDAFWHEQIGFFVSGRLVVTGQHLPLFSTAVVLVPDPDVSGGPLAAYAKIDPGRPSGLVERPEDAAVWLWADVDGWFGGMHLAVGLPYRVEVRRAGCAPVEFGVRRFRLFDFWSRRLQLEVPPCPIRSLPGVVASALSFATRR